MNIRKLFLVFAAIFIAGTFSTEQSVAQNIVANPERPPMFMGGSDAMNTFISTTMRFPDDAFARRAQGLVVYTFVVETDGRISNIRPVRVVDPSLDAEALRIIQAMPPWQPAEHRGLLVRAEATVPMFFTINPYALTNAPAQQQTTINYARTDLSIMENYAVFTIVDRMPQFERGSIDLSNFLSRHICYPLDALEQGIEGRVLCSFIVAPDGSISNIEVISSDNSLLNHEAIRVLSLMPNWRPGERNGVPVHVRVLLPIYFEID